MKRYKNIMPHHNSIAILGIHTGIGKTIASAVIAEAIGADYWKPVQAGIEERDIDLVSRLLTDGLGRVHPEAVVLSQPMSPHAAAAIDNVDIDFTKFEWPVTNKTLLVETAGGILSPMSSTTTMADFVLHYQLPVILVVQNYLGSINHSLLSIEVLKNRGVNLLGIVINGTPNSDSETFIEQYSKVPVIARIPHLETLDNATVVKHAHEIKSRLAGIV
ncbi:MAG: bioD [Flavipsychrobacter sp.]|nr:bioD [Flavipsychrobacter sp.]